MMYRTIKKLYFEPSSRCNLNCAMCFRNSWIGETHGDLEMRLFYKALKDEEALRDTHTIFFGGMGEPLVHPCIFEMIRCSKEQGKRVELITNGTMLTPEVSRKLVAAGLDKLWVSIDSFEAEQYEQLQRGSKFALITRQIREFSRVRQNTETELGISFVLMKSNLPQLMHMQRYCCEIGADDVNLSHMIPNTEDVVEDTLWQFTENAQTLDEFSKPIVARFRFQTTDFDKLYGQNPIVSMMNEKMELLWRGKVPEREKDRCRFVAEGNCFIRWDGAVTSCMGLLHSAETYLDHEKRMVWHHAFGNLKEQPLHAIWNSEEYRAFRKRVMEFDFSPCINCGGCDLREENQTDCVGSPAPTCGACLWGQGFIRCP